MGAILLAKAYFQPPEDATECPGLFVSKLTPQVPEHDQDSESITDPVGVSLLAKASFQPLKI